MGAPSNGACPFCAEYNDERPHESLQDATPASCYQPSPRAYPSSLPPLEYPGHYEVRRVSTAGVISWAGAPLFISEALAGEDIAFEEIDEGLWTIRFATVALGHFDARRCRIHPLATISAGRSASAAGSAPSRTEPNR